MVKELNKTVWDLKNRNIKENTKGDNPGDGKPRQKNRSLSSKHHLQNTRDRSAHVLHSSLPIVVYLASLYSFVHDTL